jgi:nucleotide-binding universal stress UspA family protein
MALKDILIHLDNSSGCPARLELAINLARSHGAHLKGLYVIAHPYYAPRHGSSEENGARAMHTLFTEKTTAAGIPAEWLYIDWSVVGVSVTEIVTLYAYYADLVVVGQPDAEAKTPLDLPEQLGLGAGRPLLVVPCSGSFPTMGERVMVAWKAGRESVRAANDAMPILEKAARVSIISVGTFGYHDRVAEETAQRFCAHLAHHQVRADHEQILASGLPIGDLLLKHAAAQKMDLLVVGGYAMNRRGSYIFSPVVAQLLKRMTLPILLSH